MPDHPDHLLRTLFANVLDAVVFFDVVWERFRTDRNLRGDAHVRRRDGTVSVIDDRLVGGVRPGVHLLLAGSTTRTASSCVAWPTCSRPSTPSIGSVRS